MSITMGIGLSAALYFWATESSRWAVVALIVAIALDELLNF